MEKLPVFVVGPCVIESSSVLDEVAAEVARLGKLYEGRCRFFFKSSFDKANRTSLSSYRGPGLEKGLQMLADVRAGYGLGLLTDIHEAWQAGPVSEVVDILQIPAYLSRQTDLIFAAGHTGKTVNIKKGQFLSGADMKYAVEKAVAGGAHEVWLTERGNVFGYNNLVVDFRNIPVMKGFSSTVLMDCTHSVQIPNGAGGVTGGNSEYIMSMAMAGRAFGADGYYIETHPDPSSALSDAASMLSLDSLDGLVRSVLQD